MTTRSKTNGYQNCSHGQHTHISRLKIVGGNLDNYQPELLNESQIKEIYNYIDEVPMIRAKKNLNRDFADCSMMGEVIQHYLLPSYRGFIEIHNYIRTNTLNEKRDNWNMLNKKVLSKFGKAISFKLSPQHIEAII